MIINIVLIALGTSMGWFANIAYTRKLMGDYLNSLFDQEEDTENPNTLDIIHCDINAFNRFIKWLNNR